MHFSEYSSQFWIKIFNFNPKLKFTNRLPAEFAFAEEFVGDTESRPAAYSNVTLLDKRDGVVARASK
ncbi:MAG: hypothetical protein LF884_04505 [Rickettsia endosymbiont of Cimex lectularius]|nr:MAG: hypothetical protein LF884_04505 [Rickettsia endosymbiont of Cimex lectularius]